MLQFDIGENALFDIFREKRFRIMTPLVLYSKRKEAPIAITGFHINAKIVCGLFP